MGLKERVNRAAACTGACVCVHVSSAVKIYDSCAKYSFCSSKPTIMVCITKDNKTMHKPRDIERRYAVDNQYILLKMLTNLRNVTLHSKMEGQGYGKTQKYCSCVICRL